MAVAIVHGEPSTDRVADLTGWRADWALLRVAVLGLGVTGFSAADTLAELGCRVLVAAEELPEARAQILDVLGVDTYRIDADHAADSHDAVAQFETFDPELLIVSPGFQPGHALLRWARSKSVPIWGDIELAWRLRDKTGDAADWIMVTGTNGKTTTVQLAAAMLTKAGLRVAPCGNIGVPVLDAIRDPAGFDVLVVEASSYQLHWLASTGPGSLHPYASVCLNIAADHIDWHGSSEAYGAAKAKIYANTRVACVYNLADDATLRMVEDAEVADGARAIGFGLGVPGQSDLGIVDGILCDRAFAADRSTHAMELVTVDELRVAGLAAPHVLANILAASALARSYGVTPGTIRGTLSSFHLDRHRIERVVVAAGVEWVDDSKATNPHAAAASLAAYRRVVWIVGGLLKGVDIDELVRDSVPLLRAVVIIGVDREALKAAFARHAPGLRVYEVDPGETSQIMRTAVRLAGTVATSGDTVLLAPAAASMDQFASYADRGRAFQVAVHEYLGGGVDDQSASNDPGAGPEVDGGS